MNYTVRQITERYGVTEHTVLGWINRGELKAFNVGRNQGAKKPRWRITQDSLDAFEQLRTHTPPLPLARRKKKQTNIIEFYK